MTKKEIRRKRANAAARARRRRHRKRVVMAERIFLVLLVVGILAGGAAVVWYQMPEVKVERRLNDADEYKEAQAYDEAIASCEEALKIDSMSVEAYRSMAGIYLTKEDREAAEQVLYQGWETTQDESLLQEYCVYLLNDAVADINAEQCAYSTWDKVMQAVETDPDNPDGYKLLDACYERLFMGEEAQLFCEVPEGEGCRFEGYLERMNRMLALYESTGKEELKAEIIKYAQPEVASLSLDIWHLTDYQALLERVSALGSEESLSQLLACVTKAVWVQNTFAGAFDIFASGDFAPIKDFMQSEDYITIRDQFMDGTMEYWHGKTYIPVSREKITFMQVDGGWCFEFADFDEYPETEGVIKVWAVQQVDAGIQRLCISYEPASENGEYYPHTTYEFVYLYSNVKIRGQYVPQMNYRFETRIATEEGTISELIGDWGGEHEWNMEY
ncbi:MAG: tetratricopeptide repeat protein [Lachnospiraceae bacterium]|nr:tetratricopeptide repeat protein [Lachnospiraceae bacterium]